MVAVQGAKGHSAFSLATEHFGSMAPTVWSEECSSIRRNGSFRRGLEVGGGFAENEDVAGRKTAYSFLRSLLEGLVLHALAASAGRSGHAILTNGASGRQERLLGRHPDVVRARGDSSSSFGVSALCRRR